MEEHAKGALVWLRRTQKDSSFFYSKYFFSLENNTKAQQQMLSLQSPNGGIVSEPKMIRKLASECFSSLLCAKKLIWTLRIPLLNLCRSCLNHSGFRWKTLSLVELRLALSGMASGKAPGPDSIPPEFYKTFWDVIGLELLQVRQESFKVGELPPSCR